MVLILEQWASRSKCTTTGGRPPDGDRHQVQHPGQRADWTQVLKYVVWNVATPSARPATFMPKPIAGDNGSGMHVHQSVWRTANLFAGDGYAG